MPVEGRGLGSRQTQEVVRDLEIYAFLARARFHTAWTLTGPSPLATERAASTRGWQVGPDDLVVIAFLGHGAETPPRSRVRSSGNCMPASQQVAY